MSFEEKTCPQCAEKIKLAALVCKHCGKVFDSAEVAAAVSKSRRELGMGCLGLVAIIGLLAWCTSTPRPTAEDWFTPGSKSAITAFDRYPGHISVEMIAGAPAELGALPAEIASQLRAVRARLATDKEARETTTITIGIWFNASKAKGGAREPLISFNGRTADLMAVAPDAAGPALLDALESARARPPIGDLLLRDACSQAPNDYATTKPCLG